MADRKDTKTRALLSAAKNAAKDAIENLTLSEEERAAREAERKKARRRLKWKIAAVAVLALVVVVSIGALLAQVWWYLLGLLVVVVLGFFGYRWARAKVASLTQRSAPALEAKRDEEPLGAPVEVERRSAKSAEAGPSPNAEERERQIDDELAALKAKVRK